MRTTTDLKVFNVADLYFPSLLRSEMRAGRQGVVLPIVFIFFCFHLHKLKRNICHLPSKSQQVFERSHCTTKEPKWYDALVVVGLILSKHPEKNSLHNQEYFNTKSSATFCNLPQATGSKQHRAHSSLEMSQSMIKRTC